LKQPITSINAAGDVVMTIPLAGVTINSTIQILGVPRSLVPVRNFRLSSLTSQSVFSLRGWPSGVVLQNRGYLRPNVQILGRISEIVFDSVTERRIGRPFGLLRGRRAVVR